MHRFASEINELRALGFAESLSIQPAHATSVGVLRLESGRIGVAVEFCADSGAPRYAVKPLVSGVGNGLPMASEVWHDIVQDVRQRAPASDDD